MRWPRPSRLGTPLEASGKRMAGGLKALELETTGDLLEHLPVDSREARSVAGLRAGEQATVAVEVRTIAARPVRRRKMRPLVEAVVFDATGSMRATFFNQPWLVDRYPPRTRLLLHGKADGRGGFGVSHHAPSAQPLGAQPAEAQQRQAVAHYPASDGVTSTQILTLVQAARDALSDIVEFLPAGARVCERLPDRAAALAAMHFPRARGDLEAGRRRLAYEELLLAQLLFLRRRHRRNQDSGAAALRDEPSLTARWLEGALPFTPTGDQLRAIEAISADMARTRPMQRLLMGEVGSGKTVVALPRDAPGGRALPPGGPDGAHRDTGRTALRDDPAAAGSRVGQRGPPDRIDAGPPPGRHPGQAGQRRALAARRHPCPDRAGRRLPLPGRGGDR